MGNLKKWLAERKDRIEEEVSKGKERKGLSELPDGTYIAVYRTHEFGESQNENIGLKSCLRVLEGEQAGEDIWIWEDLDRENAFEWLTVRLKNSGVEIEDAQDIYDQLAKNATDVFDLVKNKTVVKVTLKTKEAKDGNMYQNKNVNKHLPDYEFDETILNNSSSTKAEDSSEKASKATAKEEDASGEEDGDELAVGMRVQFKKGKKELEGEVIELNTEDEIAKVKTDDGTVHEVGADAILGVLEDEAV